MRIVQIELGDLLRQAPVYMKGVEAKVKQFEMMRTEMHLSHVAGKIGTHSLFPVFRTCYNCADYIQDFQGYLNIHLRGGHGNGN